MDLARVAFKSDLEEALQKMFFFGYAITFLRCNLCSNIIKCLVELDASITRAFEANVIYCILQKRSLLRMEPHVVHGLVVSDSV